MNIYIYRFFLAIVSPFLYIYLLIRKFKGKEDKIRFKERFGYTNIIRPEGKVVWLHAVSVGEINSAWAIIEKLSTESDSTILVTTTTVTSAETVRKKLEKMENNKNIIHQFFPIDLYFNVKRFLKHWKPNIYIVVESEIWPNIFTMTKKYCPIFILNGKISRKSFRFWYRARKLKEQIFDSVDICLAQSKIDYKRFINIGVQRVQFLGNIKFFVQKMPVDNLYYNLLKDQIKERKLWIVNSTHNGEEQIIIDAHKILKQKYPDLLTINILRHTNRSNEVVKLINSNKLNVSIANKNDKISDNTDIYLYDKLGNLGVFFELGEVVFIAGSLKPKIGGHTPAECIKQHCCVVTGPYIENNKLLFKDLKDEDGCIILNDNKPETLAKTIDKLFSDDSLRANIANNAYVKSIKSTSVLNEITQLISDEIN